MWGPFGKATRADWAPGGGEEEKGEKGKGGGDSLLRSARTVHGLMQ